MKGSLVRFQCPGCGVESMHSSHPGNCPECGTQVRPWMPSSANPMVHHYRTAVTPSGGTITFPAGPGTDRQADGHGFDRSRAPMKTHQLRPVVAVSFPRFPTMAEHSSAQPPVYVLLPEIPKEGR